MVNPAQKKKIYGSHLDYAKKVRSKMAYSEDFVSPYIKGKTVIDWGCGPGHRSPQLIQWGANQIIALDPNHWCKHVFMNLYNGNQITWFEEGHIITEQMPELRADVFYIADVNVLVGQDAFSWWEKLLNKIHCKYYICNWRLETEAGMKAIHDDVLDSFSCWYMFSPLGWNYDEPLQVYQSDKRLSFVDHQIDYLPEDKFSLTNFPLNTLILERN